ncbi:plastidial pyruvate kinase 2 [Phtheirospermum japonicum]|uniref:Pyruvate kinase n=1 Tax=Phtheirospermum japonicum TaxID=374723 RepID=A0A830B7P8_9LAMI|nr:plastidial pyruvate kinase 2 [Phtheirospermum japonicum]
MAQVAATGLIHGAFAANPGSGSLKSRAEKLRPSYGFNSKVLEQTKKRISRGAVRVSAQITARRSTTFIEQQVIPITPEDVTKEERDQFQGLPLRGADSSMDILSKPTIRRKTKIVCTIGPSTNTREMIWKLAEAGMNVARLNMSHGDHASHQKEKEISLGIVFTGGMMSLMVKSKTEESVKCEVVDGGELKSRRHLNVRGKSATLPSITEKDWDDIKFGVENKVDFYAVSFVKDAAVVHELKNYLKDAGVDIHVIVKIESADSIPNLHSIITASDGAMVARGDSWCRIANRRGAFIAATNMLESMIVCIPTPTRAEVSDIAIAVREGGRRGYALRRNCSWEISTESSQGHEHSLFYGQKLQSLVHKLPQIWAKPSRKRVQQRLALYQGVCPIHIEFSADADETFADALALLQKQGMVKAGEQVALVQSGRQPIWRFQSTHNIQAGKRTLEMYALVSH